MTALWLRASDWSIAVSYNGSGRYEDALAAAEHAAEDPHGLGVAPWVLSDLIEAAARSGHTERAAGPLEQLAEIAEANGTDWALGTHARSRALLSEGEAAERLYREAIERSGAPASGCRSPARTWSTASGCGARTGGSTRASNCASPTRCSATWAWSRWPHEPARSCWPPVRRCASAAWRRSTS